MESAAEVPLNVTFASPVIKLDERKSIGRQSFASIGFSDQVKQKTCNGLFIDYLVRKFKNKSNIGSASSISEFIQDRRWEEEENVISPEGVSVILREELLNALRFEVEAFWNDQEELVPVHSGALKQHAASIWKATREALCLKAEVQNWLMKRKLLYSEHATADKELETIEERNQRLNGFWSQYHTTPNKRDGATDVKRAAPVSRRSAAPDEPSRKSLAQAVQRPQSPAVPQPQQFPPLGGRDRWKHRGAQGLHRFAGGREDKPLAKFQGGLGKSSFDPVRTRGNRFDREGHVSTFCTTSAKWRGGRAAMAGTMRGSVSLPELHSTNRSGNLLPVKNGNNKMREAVSLPDLHSTSRASEMLSPVKNATQAKDDRFRQTRWEKRLPPITHQFKSPWQSEGAKSSKQASPTQQYLNACEQTGIVPILTPFVTGHSTKLRGAGRALGDQDLLPVVAMLPSMSRIDEVDLSGNVLLTERCLVPLLTELFGRCASSTLQKLSLNSCLRNATRSGIQSTIETVMQLVSDDAGARCLQRLDLGGIAMGMRCHLPLCQAIQQHSYLSVVRLAEIGLTGSIALQCVDELLSCPMLQTLDLGWNSFNSEIFSHLGERAVGCNTLRTLCVANCSNAFAHGGDNPVQFLLEQISRDTTLTNLDISMNRIDFRGALVLEDALTNNRKLAELDISHNPLGVLGMRSALRLLSRESCALMYLTSKECCSSLEDDVASGIQQFNATNPGGRYVLDLHRPYHRALLRMFYRTADCFKLTPEIAFTNLEFSKGKYQHAQKDAAGVWVVPTDGRLSVTFTIEPAMAASLQDVDPYDFSRFLERQLSLMKVRPGLRKIIPMLAHWKSVDGTTKEEKVILDALARDFQFTYPQMKQLCENRWMVNDVVWRIMPCVVGGAGARYLTSMLVPSAADHLQMLRRHRNLFAFNAQNPTGRYTLDLANPGDHSVAQDILLLDRWEATTFRKMKFMDVSQRGNGSHVRNECYNDLPMFGLRSIAEWALPESGQLQLDYSSGKRPPKDAVVLDDTSFSSLLFVLERAEAPPNEQLIQSDEWQLAPLRLVSDRIWLTALQLREMLGIYRQEETREDLYVMFIMQLVDMHNEKVFRVRFERRESLANLRHRLGQAVFFPFIQPEQTWFEFDFSQYDQRLAANALMSIAAKEAHSNLSDVTYVREDGTVDPLPLGVPRAWEIWEKMPTGGRFTGKYACAPEQRNYKTRAALLESHSLWKAPEQESAVMWWAVLTETPEDVLVYLEFLVARFPDVFLAFREIDGPDGNGQITKREFEDGVKQMNCRKFKGPNEAARVHAIFRYLDPSGEGQVSMDEWSILDLLFREIQLSIKEFVKFLIRTFGANLGEAWEALDEDHSGEIDFHEWEDVLTKIGYFGPSRPIFSYLDKDGEGTISCDEFQTLTTFQESAEKSPSTSKKRRTLASLSSLGSPAHLR